MSERERRIDSIRATSDRLTELARRYDRLRWMAEKEVATDAFINLAEAAGKMTESSLEGTANILHILFSTQFEVKP